MIARTCERSGREIGCRMVAIQPAHTTGDDRLYRLKGRD